MPYYDRIFYDFERWHYVVKRKYDAYASKKDVEVQTQDRIELFVKVIEGLKEDALMCAMDLGRDVVVGNQSFLGWQTRDRNADAESERPFWGK